MPRPASTLLKKEVPPPSLIIDIVFCGCMTEVTGLTEGIVTTTLLVSSLITIFNESATIDLCLG